MELTKPTQIYYIHFIKQIRDKMCAYRTELLFNTFGL